MRRFISALALCAILAPAAHAVTVHNSRAVPDTTDFTAFGEQGRWKMLYVLLKDLANILPSSAGGDGINIDSLRGNPDVDSLGGSILIDTLVGQRSGGVIVNDSLKVVNQVLASKADLDSIKGPVTIDTIATGVYIKGRADCVGRFNLDTIRSTPDVDSLAGNVVFKGKPSFADTTTVAKLVVKSGSAVVDSFAADTANDTITIRIKGYKYKWAAVNY